MRAKIHLVAASVLVTSSAVLSAAAVMPVHALRVPSHTEATDQGPTPGLLSGDSKTNCVYPADSISELDGFSTLTGATFNCVLLYNDAKPSWGDWTNVWWVSPPSPDANWLAWLGAQAGRRLVISQPMVPDDVPSDWRVLGAEGAYDGYATQLATNLVDEGMGNSIIRLGWEANDPVNPGNELGSDPTQYADWATYWGNIVRSMRAVPGAAFQFDWTINQYYQPIPLASWYPGDDVVDIIGIDAYDSGVYQTDLTPEQRWDTLYNEPDGLAQVAAFASEHAKPLSIPEWGLEIPSISGAGDDPAYVQGLGTFIADNDVEYNSYFYGGSGSDMVYFPDAPQSLAAYQEYFLGLTSVGGPAPSSSTTVASSPSTTVASSTSSTVTTVAGPPPQTATTASPGTTGQAPAPVATSTSAGSVPAASGVGGATTPGGVGTSVSAPPTTKPMAGPAPTGPGSASAGSPIRRRALPPSPVLMATAAGSVIGGPALRPEKTKISVPKSILGRKQVVGVAATPDAGGYWLVDADGAVRGFGDAHLYKRSARPKPTATAGAKAIVGGAPVVGMAATPDGRGYWLVDADGAVRGFGDAHLYKRSARPKPTATAGAKAIVGGAPVVGMAATPDGRGYWLVDADGAVRGFGDAHLYKRSAGPTEPRAGAKPIVGMAATPDGRGYLLVAGDGAVYAFGDAQFYGEGVRSTAKAVTGIEAPAGRGYWVVFKNGVVLSFGSAAPIGVAHVSSAIACATAR